MLVARVSVLGWPFILHGTRGFLVHDAGPIAAPQRWSASGDDLKVRIPPTASYDPSDMLTCVVFHVPSTFRLFPAGACSTCPAGVQHADRADQRTGWWYPYALPLLATCSNVWLVVMPIAVGGCGRGHTRCCGSVAVAVSIPAAFSEEFPRVLSCACPRLCASRLPWSSAPVAGHGLWLAVTCGWPCPVAVPVASHPHSHPPCISARIWPYSGFLQVSAGWPIRGKANVLDAANHFVDAAFNET